MNNTRAFLQQADVQVVAVCDVDAQRRLSAQKTVNDHYGRQVGAGQYRGCQVYRDFRELLTRPDIDAVMIATPDHWHAVMAIAAARAGKDIYCEKPISLTIAEGRAVCQAVERYARVFQTGSHRRSLARFRIGCEWVRNGCIGKLHTIRTGVPTGKTVGPQPVMSPPEGFDYDLWLGPAPYAPYTPLRCHTNFRHIHDYAGGMVTDLGAHFNDIAQWGHGTDHTGPIQVKGKGTFPRDGLFNTPVHVHFECVYADGVRLICEDRDPKPLIGTRFEGSEGWVDIGYARTTTFPESIQRVRLDPRDKRLYRSDNHYRNFIDCVKTRQSTVVPPEIGHRSATVCHLGNIAMRLGRQLHWDPNGERFVQDDVANRMLSRPKRGPWPL
jgi:predicted dehydrogenase